MKANFLWQCWEWPSKGSSRERKEPRGGFNFISSYSIFHLLSKVSGEKKLPLYQLGCSEEVEWLVRSSAWEVILTGFKGRIRLQEEIRLNPGSALLRGLCGRAQVI